MSLWIKITLAITIVVVVVTSGYYLFHDPNRVDNSYYHPDKFQMIADVNGQPLSNKIAIADYLPLRFRCPVPPGEDKKARFAVFLYICDPTTYTNSEIVVAHQQSFGGPGVALTLNGQSGTQNVTPPMPTPEENVFQFCALLSGKSLSKSKPRVPKEMHMWMYRITKRPDGGDEISKVGEWVFRHAFEFVEGSTAN